MTTVIENNTQNVSTFDIASLFHPTSDVAFTTLCRQLSQNHIKLLSAWIWGAVCILPTPVDAYIFVYKFKQQGDNSERQQPALTHHSLQSFTYLLWKIKPCKYTSCMIYSKDCTFFFCTFRPPSSLYGKWVGFFIPT